jgi:hypothetical protein
MLALADDFPAERKAAPASVSIACDEAICMIRS